jgi:hypothetical protein
MKFYSPRHGPPLSNYVSNLSIESNKWKKEFKEGAGNYSRSTSSNTVWPNGCRESESKSGISRYWTVRKGGPEALKQEIANETKQRANNIPGPSDRVIPCCGLVSVRRNPKAHTA